MTTEAIASGQTSDRAFSIRSYLLIVFAVSWPFQFAYVALGDAWRPLLLLSMIMVSVGTFIAGRYVFGDGFANAGWRWGKPRHYALAFGLALFLWLVPSVVERAIGVFEGAPVGIGSVLSTFALSFVVTLIPAFGEEFGWRGYLLPRLMKRYRPRRALLLHGAITWIWHLPVVVVMGTQLGGHPLAAVALIIGVSLIPTVMHAIVFAYIWSSSGSLATATVYHAAFDEVRDSLDETIGLGTLGQNWQMLVLTILGLALLWRAKWRQPGS